MSSPTSSKSCASSMSRIMSSPWPWPGDGLCRICHNSPIEKLRCSQVVCFPFLPLSSHGLDANRAGYCVATSTLFRRNSVFTKAMEFTLRFYGRSFLDASVGPVIRRLCNERVEIRLDPSSHAISQLDQERPRSSGRDGAVDAAKTLGYWCNEFWNQIYYVRTECPM